jgi:glucokinase
MTTTAVIALDLGGTKLAAAIFTPKSKIVIQRAVPLAGRRGHAVGQLICCQLKALLAVARTSRLQVTAVGISVPGISRAKTGRVWAPNIPGWQDYPLSREILSTLRDTRISVAIDSDRACCILGETWRGAAQDCRNAIFLAVGTGIGAGILVDGRILRGARDIAGAIGWLALTRPFRPEYVGCGCFEYHASGTGLAKVANELLSQHSITPSLHHSSSASFRSARDVFAAHHRGRPVAKATLAQAVEFWGMAVANLVSLFNPEKIIFGGGVFGPGASFLPRIRAEARKWAQPISIKQVRIVASKLGPNAALYGAARLALQAEPAPRT